MVKKGIMPLTIYIFFLAINMTYAGMGGKKGYLVTDFFHEGLIVQN